MERKEKKFLRINKKPYRTDVSIEEIISLLVDYGFEYKDQHATSHHKFTHPKLPYHLSIPTINGRLVKPTYVKKVIEAIEELQNNNDF